MIKNVTTSEELHVEAKYSFSQYLCGWSLDGPHQADLEKPFSQTACVRAWDHGQTTL